MAGSVIQSDFDVLVALYNSTNGTNWTNKTGWNTLTNENVGSWYGVTVVGDRITGLNLSDNNLNGIMPTQLGNLSDLRTLSFYNNQLTGPIPSQLGNLSSLQYLYLHKNQLTGGIPSQLSNLTNLLSLYLNNNQLTGGIPSQLSNLTNLRTLSLYSNQLTEPIPTQLGNLSSLQYLYLHNNQLTGVIPSQLGNLTNLRTLYLNSNKLTGAIPPQIGQITNLQRLRVDDNLLIGPLPITITNRTWTELNLENPPYVAQEIPNQQIAQNSLFTLNISSNFADLNSDTITYSATGLPSGLNLNPNTGLISGQSNLQGAYNVTITGTDNDGSVADTFSLTINNSLPSISLTLNPSSVLEDGITNLIYTFTRTGNLTNSLTVDYTIGGTATNGTDYDTIGTSITFAPNTSTAIVTVNPTADSTVESDETVALTLTSNGNYTIGTTGGVIGTITNDDTVTLPTITLSLSPSSVLEDGITNLIYTFTRTGNLTNSLTVDYTIGGTATNGTDYDTIGTSITFAPNTSTAIVTVNPTADSTVESDETVALTLTSNGNYTIGTTGGVIGTITNDDTVTLPTITLSLSPSSVLEDGITNLIYTFTRTGNLTNSLTVDYTIGGTATNGTDYDTIGTSITFAPNTSTAIVTVNPTADSTVESDETVALTLTSNATYTIGTTGGVTGTITNDDTVTLPTITLSLSPSSVLEDGITNLIYTFTRTGNLTNSLTVDYTIGGTATNGTDYDTIGTSITFAPNTSTAIVTVNPTADSTVESDETVALTLANNANYTIGTTGGVTGTITNDDTVTLPTITVNTTDAQAAETNSGQTANTGVFRFTRTGSTASALTVNYTMSGTATNSTDYNNLTGSITFNAGNSTVDLALTPINDNLGEGDETAIVTLNTNANYTVGTANTATVTIADNDTVFNFSDSTYSVNEDGTVVTAVTINRTGIITNAVSVTVTPTNGTATTADYNNNPIVINFLANEISKVVTIPIINDTLIENNETVNLTLSTPSGGAILGTQTTAILTIIDNDSSGILVTGTANNDNLAGGTGNDTLQGLAGNDTLNGGAGADSLDGGTGNDTYYVDNVGDLVVEAVNAGTDTVNATVNFTLPTNVEKLILTGTANLNGTGNTLANTMTGNTGNNTLTGGDGNDKLDGKAGVDTLDGGNGNDSYVLDNVNDVIIDSAGTDSVSASFTYTLASNLENLTLTGSTVINGTGNSGANKLTGNSGANTLTGLDGNDSLTGGNGIDTLLGGNGNDTLVGGTGNDSLTGGSGLDSFRFNATTEGIDIITDFVVADDTILVSRSSFGGGLIVGTLASTQFTIGASATTSDHRFLYDSGNGQFWYDSDGNGATIAPVQIATLSTGLGLTNADIVVF